MTTYIRLKHLKRTNLYWFEEAYPNLGKPRGVFLRRDEFERMRTRFALKQDTPNLLELVGPAFTPLKSAS